MGADVRERDVGWHRICSEARERACVCQ
jgi:hypothetical protein